MSPHILLGNSKYVHVGGSPSHFPTREVVVNQMGKKKKKRVGLVEF